MERCFAFVDQKFDQTKLKELIQSQTKDDWANLIEDHTCLWPMFDQHKWTREEYEPWVKKNGWDLDASLFPHQIRPQEEIIDMLKLFPENVRVYLYNDLLIIQSEFLPPFTDFFLKNYEYYGVDRKELLALRLDGFIQSQARSQREINSFILGQITYLENPGLWHNVSRSVKMDQVEIQLRNANWLK